MKRPTNITIAGIIILIIIIICIFLFSGNKNSTKNNVESENTQSNNISNTENTINENENTEIETENTVTEEAVQTEMENIAEHNGENDIIPTEIFTEMPQDAQEKAIKIVENDWEGSDVSFSVTGMDVNGNYIVQVTDMNTEVLAFYTVNVSDSSFTKREMN